jgi:hypothetical protein
MSDLPLKEMAAFEAWAKQAHPGMWTNPHEDSTYQWGGHYHNAAVNLMWQGWQARAAHEPLHAPVEGSAQGEPHPHEITGEAGILVAELCPTCGRDLLDKAVG